MYQVLETNWYIHFSTSYGPAFLQYAIIQLCNFYEIFRTRTYKQNLMEYAWEPMNHFAC